MILTILILIDYNTGGNEEDVIPASTTNVLPLPRFDTSEFNQVTSNPEYKSLLQFIDRFQPTDINPEAKLKPFIPSYIPSVGEVDPFIKIKLS